MRIAWTIPVSCLALVGTACDPGPEPAAEINAESTADEPLAPPAPADNAGLQEPPPMIVRSPAYRCDDGDALYVDVLTDKTAVTVRDSRVDTPVRLDRSGPDGPFAGGGRSLSGTGDEVRYSSTDRPDQTCRVAQE